MFRDVHYYDGKMEDAFTPEKQYNEVEKREMFKKLQKKLVHADAKGMVDIIIGGGNNDTTNGVNACDVLAEICGAITDDMMPFLEEQLVDNYRLGRCPQGRSWRLLQIYRVLQPMKKELEEQKKVEEERKYLDKLLEGVEEEDKKGYVRRFLKSPEKRKKLYRELKLKKGLESYRKK